MDTKELRKKLGLTQEQFANKLGVHKMTVKRWEAGVAKPSQLARRQLARWEQKRLGCKPSQ